MSNRNLHLSVVIIFLFVLGTSLFLYRWLHFKVPLTPAKTQDSWTIEANLQFKAGSGPIKVAFYIPNNPPNFATLDESFVSRNYGVTAQKQGPNRIASWSIRRATGMQSIYYRGVFYRSDSLSPPLTAPDYIEKEAVDDTQKLAIDNILDRARRRSADISTFAIETIKILNNGNSDNAAILLNGDDSVENVIKTAILVLSYANIYAEQMNGFHLKTQQSADLQHWLIIYNEQKWIYLNPRTGQVGLPQNFLIWQYGAQPLSSVEGGSQTQFSLSISENLVSALQIAKIRGALRQSQLLRFSAFELPLKSQYVYRIILTVPIGAFVILLLRNFIGIATFGTFMPVLIALAFRETNLIIGIVLFVFIVAAGLCVRFYLEQLRLLLVPRLTAILTIVILLMFAISILSQRLGLESGLSIALFPMVILTMTIERMCITWDERGADEAIKSVTGSLVAAVFAYLVMHQANVEYLFFSFPELLLSLLGIILLTGQYHGYRLSELYRFKSLLKDNNRLNV